jgi:hypothetical protein
MSAVLDFPGIPPEVQVQVNTTEELQQITTFLGKYPGLQEALHAGLQQVHHAFPTSAHVLVTLETDPDIAGWDYLVVAIPTALPVAEAQTRFNTFVDAWWLEHIAEFGDVLRFDLEYV